MKKNIIYTVLSLLYLVSLSSYAITIRGTYTQGDTSINWDLLAPHSSGSNTWITGWDSITSSLEPTAEWLPYGVQSSTTGATFQHVDGTALSGSPNMSVTGVAYHLGTTDRQSLALSTWGAVPGSTSSAATSSLPFIYMRSSNFDSHFSSIIASNDTAAYTPFIAIAPLMTFNESDLVSALDATTKTGIFRVHIPFSFRYLYKDPNSGIITQRINSQHQVTIEIDKIGGYLTDVIIDPYDEIPATYHSGTVSGQLDIFGRAEGYLPGGLLKMSVNSSDVFTLQSVRDPTNTIPFSFECILACSQTEVVIDGAVRNNSVVIDSGGNEALIPMQFKVSYGLHSNTVLREDLITDYYRGTINLDFEPNY